MLAPDQKPAKVDSAAKPKSQKAKTAKSRTRSFRREVDRLFSATGKLFSGQ